MEAHANRSIGAHFRLHPSAWKGHPANFSLRLYGILSRSIPAHHAHRAVGVSNHRLRYTAYQRLPYGVKPSVTYHDVPMSLPSGTGSGRSLTSSGRNPPCLHNLAQLVVGIVTS